MKHVWNNNSWFAMGIAFLGWLLVAATADAQPRRSRRYNEGAQALAQVAQPQPGPQCSADDANVARQYRGRGLDAFEAHDWNVCVSEYTVAQTRCPTPEGGFNLAYCLENLGQLAQAIERYEELLRGPRLPAEVTEEQLRRTIESVRSRLPRVTPPVVVPVPPPACAANTQTDPRNCGRCGNACAAGQVCTAGVCRSVATAPPVVAPLPRRSHALPIALLTAGGVGLGVGIPLGVIAGNDAATLCDVQRVAGCNRLASGMDPRTAEVIGWTIAGVGAAAAVAGLLIEILPRGHETTPPPRGITARPTASIAPDGTATVGVGGTF